MKTALRTIILDCACTLAGCGFYCSLLVLALTWAACSKSYRQVDSSTYWLQSCDSSSECGGLSCLCGACNAPCQDDDGCGMLSADAQCAAQPSRAPECTAARMNVCMLQCAGDGDCPAGLGCHDGACAAAPTSGPSLASGQDAGSASTMAVTQIAVGGRHACALRSDGSAQCWGSDFYGNVSESDDGPNDYVQLSAGGYHTCGLRRDGSLFCWGGDMSLLDLANMVNTTGGSDFTQISAGDLHTCALRADGSVRCWGDDANDQVSGPNGYGDDDLAQVACGYAHTCLLRAGGSLLCWGRDLYGEVSGPNGDGGSDFTQVGAGDGHTCALRSDGSLRCWGSAEWQDEVSGPNADSRSDFVQLMVAAYQTCGLHQDGSVTCWGDDTDGQVSGFNGDVAQGFVQLSGSIEVDGNYLCGLRQSGSVACWGNDDAQQVSSLPSALR